MNHVDDGSLVFKRVKEEASGFSLSSIRARGEAPAPAVLCYA